MSDLDCKGDRICENDRCVAQAPAVTPRDTGVDSALPPNDVRNDFDTSADLTERDRDSEGFDPDNYERCPTAVAEASPFQIDAWRSFVGTALGNTVKFRASGSHDNSEIVAYNWELRSRPRESSAALSDPSSEAPTMTPDANGMYRVALTVTDDAGYASCNTAQIDIAVTDGGFAFIELTWETVGGDGPELDLDLHLLHPDGAWNNIPYDIYWNNRTNEWGEPGPHDDPIHIGDTQESGRAEYIWFPRPAPGLTYSVGVFFYRGESQGSARADLALFRNGTQIGELSDAHLPATGYFWDAWDITWPGPAVTEVNVVSSGFPNRP